MIRRITRNLLDFATIRLRYQWRELMMLYALTAYLLCGAAAVYARPLFGPNVDLRDVVAEHESLIATMQERAKYNIERLDAIEAMNLPVRLATLERTSKESSDAAADLRRLGYQMLSAVIAGLVVQIIHVRSQSRAQQASVQELKDLLAALKAQS